MKSVLFAALMFGCFTIKAQIVNMPGTLNKPMSETGQYKDTNGSPYFIEEYKSGTIIDKSGKVRNVFLKYDTYQEEVELFNDGKPLLIDKNVYPRFTIEFIEEKLGKKVKYTFSNEIQIPGQKKSKYSLLLAEGEKVKIVKVFETVLNQSQDAGYGGSVTPHWFQTKEIYYILKPDGKFLEVKPSNKSLLKAFDNNSTLKSHLKKQKIKIRDEKDLVGVVDFLVIVFFHQILSYIIMNTLFKFMKGLSKANSLKFIHAGLCVVLIFIAYIKWGVYK